MNKKEQQELRERLIDEIKVFLERTSNTDGLDFSIERRYLPYLLSLLPEANEQRGDVKMTTTEMRDAIEKAKNSDEEIYIPSNIDQREPALDAGEFIRDRERTYRKLWANWNITERENALDEYLSHHKKQWDAEKAELVYRLTEMVNAWGCVDQLNQNATPVVKAKELLSDTNKPKTP